MSKDTKLHLEPPFRWAFKGDAPKIAELFRIASDGVSDYVWSKLTADYPGLDLLEIGAQRYARKNTEFSYQNCIVAEIDGQVAGMLLTFPMAAKPESPQVDEAPFPEGDGQPNVLSPYGELEVPGSLYVCATAFFPGYRGRGLGTRLMAVAGEQAREIGHSVLSLLVFEENRRAVALYHRLGYREIDRRPVVPHPLIRHTGAVILMVKGI
jgi:ribosomal protein S18 acetylase RimI-like enzyme